MIQKYPALRCNLLLLLGFLLTGITAQAQLDYKTTETVIGFNMVTQNTMNVSSFDEDIIFSEKGQGKLINGTAQIEIEANLARLIEGSKIDEMITVAIQLEGKSNGVYISKKDKNSFVITELDNGTSNANFSYSFIVREPK